MSYSAMELAEAFLKTGELDDALDALNQHLDASPQDDEARRLRIQIQTRLLSQADLSDLLTEFDRLNGLTVADYQTKSVIFERLSRIREAIESIQIARQLSSDDERLSERLLDLLLAHGAYDEALTLVREQERHWRWLEREGDILVLLGDDMLATARYGLVLAQLEEFEGTMQKDYLQALKVRVILARAHAYRRLQYTDTAKELYQKAQLLMNGDVSIQFNQGLIAYMEGDIDTAGALCAGAIAGASSGLKAEMMSALDEDEAFAPLKQILNL